MKYIVRKSWFAANEGEILHQTVGGSLKKNDGDTYSVIPSFMVQPALDQGFIEPYEEKPKFQFGDRVHHDNSKNLGVVIGVNTKDSRYPYRVVFDGELKDHTDWFAEKVLIKGWEVLADNEVSDE